MKFSRDPLLLYCASSGGEHDRIGWGTGGKYENFPFAKSLISRILNNFIINHRIMLFIKFRQSLPLILILLLLIHCNKENTKPEKTSFTLSGVLVYKGNPLMDASVILDENIVYQATTNAEGYFEINDIPEGIYTLKARKTFENGSFTELTSEISVDKDTYVDDLKLPEAVTLEEVSELTSNSMKLVWTKSDANDFREYKLYRHLTSGLDETTGTLVHVATSIADTIFTDQDLSPTTEYYYRVYVMNDYGRLGGSNIVSGITEILNFIWNGDFEDNTGLLTWWSSVNGISVEITSTTKVQGNYSLCIHADTTEDENGWINGGSLVKWYTSSGTDFPFETGRQYKLSGWMKTQGITEGWSAPVPALGGPDAQATIQLQDEFGFARLVIGGNTDWTYFEDIFLYQDYTGTDARFLQLFSICEYTWYDDIRIEPVLQ